jgi:arginine-tRNA-protein transferase
MSSISLLVSPPHSCSYLADRQAQSAFVGPELLLDTALYSKLITQGFRRSGNEVYSPRCPNCSECIACRIPVTQFKPSRNQKRCLKKNQQTAVRVTAAVFKQQHYDLYQRYQHYKHPNSGMATSTANEYIDFLSSSWCTSCFVEFYINEQLAAVAVVDFLDNALSAVYTFFDPDLSTYSLGVYAVLWQIEQAQYLEMDYVYLGFWIADCQKMAYKTQYQPLQGFINRQWEFIK